MPLNIKHAEVERLVEEISRLTGETKTEAIRRALVERRSRLNLRITPESRARRIERFLVEEVWSRVPASQRGRAPDREERERILGYGAEGV